MSQRAIAVGCWLAVIPVAALIARQWVFAVVLAVWTVVATLLANDDA